MLNDALSWAEIEKGRSITYQKLFSEIIEGKDKTREHVFAYNELAEIIEIFQTWESSIDEFSGLKENIKTAFTCGPLLPEDEQAENSGNRPRNDSFVLLLAGKLINAGIEVLGVEGILRTDQMRVPALVVAKFLKSDIWISYSKVNIAIQCKRPLSLKAVSKRVKDARNQLNGTVGIIAIDCSSFLRPPEMELHASTSEKAGKFLTNELSSKVVPLIENEFAPNVMGVVLNMRTPVKTIDKVSPILNLTGEPITTYIQETASTLFFMGNPTSPNVKTFQAIRDTYLVTLSDGKPSASNM